MRTFFSINNMPEQLVCPGVTFETAFVDDAVPATLVTVSRVEPTFDIKLRRRRVVKFSDKKFAIPDAADIQLGTFRYYSECEEAGEGIQDELEGCFEEDISRFMPDRIEVRRGYVTGTITQAVQNRWVYCASQVPVLSSDTDIQRLGNKFGYECATNILDPGKFAQELGALLAIHTSWADVELPTFLDKLLQSQRAVNPQGIERVIAVHHGPVHYPKDAAAMVYSYPRLRQGAMVPFQKRPEFAWQQEYRFVMGFGGETVSPTLLLPIPPGLRDLTSF